jgi:hypothetical protein
MHDDCSQVDELLRQLADYKNDVTTWQPKNFYGSAQPVGKLTDICKTACTMPGCPIAPGSRCDRSSKRYRCSCTNGKSTAGRMNQFEKRKKKCRSLGLHHCLHQFFTCLRQFPFGCFKIQQFNVRRFHGHRHKCLHTRRFNHLNG